MVVINTRSINNWATPALSEPCISVPHGSELITAFGDFVGDIRVAFVGDPTQPDVKVYCRVYTDGAMIEPREMVEWKHLASFFHPEQNKSMHVFYRPF